MGRFIHKILTVFGLLIIATSSQAQITLSDNGVHVDRGVLYTNEPFLTASGGTSPYTFTNTGVMPFGLFLNSDGSVTGLTCDTNGTKPINADATDSLGATGSGTNLNIIVNRAPAGGCSLTFDTVTISNGTKYNFYSQTITTSGGTSPYTYSLASGSLPTGLTLSSGGVISGTPTVPGTYTFSIYATDSSGSTGVQTFTITISDSPLTISPSSMSNGTVNVSYSQTITTSGGTSPYTYSLNSGSLPTGLTLSSGGVISGTPTVAGTYNFVVRSTDSNSNIKDQSYTITVDVNMATSPSSLPNASNNTAYSQTLSTVGGIGPYSYSLNSGSLPTGLTLSSGGVISGTPTVPGTYNFTVRVTDNNSNTYDKSYSITVEANMVISPSTLNNAVNNTSYSQTITTTGGTAPYSYSLNSGSLPTGLTLSSGGVISGTPTVPGTYNFVILITDNSGTTTTKSYSIVVAANMAINPSSIPNGTNGISYSQTITTSGGTSPYSYSLASGSLPTGLTLSAGGSISGIPTTDGTYNFTVRVTDGLGATTTQSYTITIATVNLLISPGTLQGGTLNGNYNQTVTTTGGTAPYTYIITSGSLPTGLTLSSGGIISGTPTVAGTYNFVIKSTDNIGVINTKNYSITINNIITGTVIVPNYNGISGTNLSFTPVTFNGGTAPFVFSILPTLPTGLIFNSNDGSIQGTPTVTTSAISYTVTVLDANGTSANKTFVMAVSAPIQIQILNVVNIVSGKIFSTQLNAQGGVAPYTYTARTALPEGLSLSSNGLLSGRARIPGTYSLTIRATDINGNFAEKTLTIIVAERDDPTLNADILGIQNAQLESLKRVTNNQTNSVLSHLEGTRDCLQSSLKLNVSDAEGKSVDLGQLSKEFNKDNSSPQCSKVALWMGTSFNYGKDKNNNYKYNNPGYIIGVDYKINQDLLIGGAFNVSRDESSFENGAGNSAHSKSFSLYSGYKINQKLFFDGVIGMGNTYFENHREIEDESIKLNGNRHATQQFGALRISGLHQFSDFSFMPFIKYETAQANLKSYSETGDSMLGVHYHNSDYKYSNASIGLKVSQKLQYEVGQFEPFVKIETQNRKSGDFNQKMNYVDQPNKVYTLTNTANSYVNNILSLGVNYTSKTGINSSINYSISNGGGISNQSVSANLKISF